MYAERKMAAARVRGDTRAEQYWRHVKQALETSRPATGADLFLVFDTPAHTPAVRENEIPQELPRRRRPR